MNIRRVHETQERKDSVVKGIPIGQLLIEAGVLSEKQVQHILRVQKESHRPFGDLAERLFGINPSAVEDAWVEQYVRTAGVVDLDDVDIDTECLRLINRRQAWQFHVLPAYRDVNAMNLATSPEDLVRAVNFSSKKIDEPLSFLIAERSQLREFLMKHFPVPQFIANYSEAMK